MSYSHLTREQRHTIASLNSQGESRAYIASVLDRQRSTIDRELKRNSVTPGHYTFTKADKTARKRSREAACRKPRIPAESLNSMRQKLITQQWSPE